MDNSNTFRSTSFGFNYVPEVDSKMLFNRHLLKIIVWLLKYWVIQLLNNNSSPFFNELVNLDKIQ